MLLRFSRLACGEASSLRPLTQTALLTGPLYIQSRNAGGPKPKKPRKKYQEKIERKRQKKALQNGTKMWTGAEMRRAIRIADREASEEPVVKLTNRQIQRAAMKTAGNEDDPDGGVSSPSASPEIKRIRKPQPPARETDRPRELPIRRTSGSEDRPREFPSRRSLGLDTDRPKEFLTRRTPGLETDRPREFPTRRTQGAGTDRPSRSPAESVEVPKSDRPKEFLIRGIPVLEDPADEHLSSPEVEDGASPSEALPLEEAASAVDDMMHSFDAEWEHAARTDRTGPRRDQRANVTRPDQEDSSSDHKEDGDFATTNLDEAEAVAKARDGDVLKRMERERQQLLHHGAKSILHKRSPTALLNKPRTPLELASPKTRRKFYASREPAITKVIFSGIQPTGIPHLGNYLGALRGWVQLQNEADSNTKLIFSLVDLHALTVQQNPEALRKQKLDSFATLMAIGLDPQQCTIFHQSDVSAHAELMWILSCQASTGHLSRMTQWKDKTGDESEESGKLKLGLFSYPVLQAADILVHGATHVPVGEDQAQHLEFTRDLASSFNHNFGGLLKSTLLTPPQTIISPAKRIRSLTDPALKMSKSHPNDKSRILLTDDENVIRNKIKTAVTDSIETEITYDPETRPGISNLIDILYYADPDYKAPTINDPTKIPNEQEESPSDLPSTEPTEAFNPIAQAAAELAAKHALAADLADLSKKAFKDRVADVVEETVKPIREKFSSLVGNPSLLEMEAELGARKARENAEVCLGRVRRAVGLR